MKNLLTFALSVGISIHACIGQPMENVPMDESHWDVQSDNFRFEEYLGVPGLFLPDGFANLNGVNFHNGIIEFDIAFPQGRGFPGISFRIQDNENYEELYIRPHQSGNPDANQYTPIFNGLAGWQLYYGEGHAAPVRYNYDAWNHVKLVISGTVGEAYINDIETPLFQIYELKFGDISGSIALKGNANAHFANFSYSLQDNPKLVLPAKDLPAIDNNVVQKYLVSNAIADADVIGKPSLDIGKISNLEWKELACEYTGTINIARVTRREEGKNTALVRIDITSETDQLKRMEFGFSDIAQVFVNGKSIYMGQNIFRSRDYRYLGTIGYFDAVFLDLKKGENEVIIAVNEAFGGWGMKAKLENMEGIAVN